VRITRAVGTGAHCNIGHVDLFAHTIGHEIGRHAGQRAEPMRLDHLLNGGAAFGQVLEDRQPLGRTAVLTSHGGRTRARRPSDRPAY
jgi:hypothetical protein